MSRWKVAAIALAAFAVIVSLLNASWIAPRPTGKLILVAHRGIAQQFDRTGIDNQTCTATRIRPLEHNFIENTLFSMRHAVRLGADVVELDVAPTADGQMVVFHDWTLDCRTDGKGEVRAHKLADLKRLDIGYGYTADGGRTFPLRGRGVGAMPAVEDVLQGMGRTPLMFNFKSRDPNEADLLLAAFARAGVKPDQRHSFYGHPAVVARMKQHVPDAWTFTKEGAKTCLVDYAKLGWTGFMPESCRDTTVFVPLNYQWAIWGWPNRFLARMAEANSRVILMGDYKDGIGAGIERPEQLADVPRAYRGYLWVEDFYNVGRALQR
ncbi:glycerophosphodiester phosphodiesterase family protein [Sphingosinicella sp. LY1275]|uniref:glycerophosphodiester phosphodiesterase family protein n=1 Tax=Sphingosinicella sp. LY1275 TaxID=3095379 RepID=UPI002ADED50C|nr:glycerophosphodiester phosphodiesterase family protein [Sphingosinicella sp. LY1275]MEA1015443.1 glycerophosphodiester phosphodiesterase family protein [Sphingosinicella sp. LY1275]